MSSLASPIASVGPWASRFAKAAASSPNFSAGTTLLTLSRLDEVWLSVYVPEPKLGQIKIGQTARVRLDGSTNEYAGKVTFISPEAEFTPRNVQTPDERAKLVYRVKITLPNPDGVFKSGLPADGFLTP